MRHGRGWKHWGLSPRVRGNHESSCAASLAGGSIPACAGEPPAKRRSPKDGRVYPRVCGGTRTTRRGIHPGAGLSPRVRGNRALAHRDHRDGGSIPACAGEPGSGLWRAPHSRVYPRVCGGTGPSTIPMRRFRGLSPRVRGNPRTASPTATRRGSIPACAGEPVPSLTWRPKERVYPRVCGGTKPVQSQDRRRKGLSPRVRGNLTTLLPHQARWGSIPACAGEPGSTAAGGAAWGVYPRVCGGTPYATRSASSSMGLSPRVRGNLRSTASSGLIGGSIPACAGEPGSSVCCG